MMRRWVLSQYFVLYVSVAYFLALWPLTPGLATPHNAFNLLSNLLPLLLVTCGQTFVLITGGIDLSATAVIGLASIGGGLVMNHANGWLSGNPWAVPAALLFMLLIGALIGIANGFAVAWLGMPPFVVTLTTMMFVGGFAIWLTKSRNIHELPSAFTQIARGSLAGVPYALVLAGVLTVIAHILLDRTLWGAWLYAAGLNARTALVSGVPVKGAVLAAYVVSGVSAAIASVLYTGRLETASPALGERLFPDVIGAAVIGGISLFGGRGRIPWAVFGVVFITLLDNSLNLLGLTNFAILIVKGLVILLAALFDTLRRQALARA